MLTKVGRYGVFWFFNQNQNTQLQRKQNRKYSTFVRLPIGGSRVDLAYGAPFGASTTGCAFRSGWHAGISDDNATVLYVQKIGRYRYFRICFADSKILNFWIDGRKAPALQVLHHPTHTPRREESKPRSSSWPPNQVRHLERSVAESKPKALAPQGDRALRRSDLGQQRDRIVCANKDWSLCGICLRIKHPHSASRTANTQLLVKAIKHSPFSK